MSNSDSYTGMKITLGAFYLVAVLCGVGLPRGAVGLPLQISGYPEQFDFMDPRDYAMTREEYYNDPMIRIRRGRYDSIIAQLKKSSLNGGSTNHNGIASLPETLRYVNGK